MHFSAFPWTGLIVIATATDSPTAVDRIVPVRVLPAGL
jgi:hypothetical protein